jgi:uncharacterized protein YlxW (UPF0749 family)
MHRPNHRVPWLRARVCWIFILLAVSGAGQTCLAADQPATSSSAEALAQAQRNLRQADENVQRAEQRAKAAQKRLQEAENAQKAAQRKVDEAQAGSKRGTRLKKLTLWQVPRSGYDDARSVIEKIYQSCQGLVR